MSNNFQETLLREIDLLLQPLAAAARSDLRRRQVFASLGWDLEAITGLPLDELSGVLTQFVDAYDAVIRLVETPPESLDELSQALDTVATTTDAIRRLSTIMDGSGLVRPPQFENLGRDLLDFLAADYLRNYHPVAYQLAVLLTIIRVGREPEDPILDGVSGMVVRIPHVRPRLALDRLADLLANPIAVLRAEYLGPNGLSTAADAKATTDRLFPRLGSLLDVLGMNSLYSIKPDYGIDFGQAGNEFSSGMLTFFLPLGQGIEGGGLGATLALSPADRGDLGMVVAPFGELVLAETLGRWALDLEVMGDIPAFAIGPGGLTLPAASTTPSVRGQLSAAKLPEGGTDVALLVGSTTGTRLEVGQLMISGQVSLDHQGQDYGLLAEAGSAAFVISPGDGDGFLQEVLPREGIRTDFDLALGWSNRTGLHFRGSAGLEASLPVEASLLGLVTVDSVFLALRAEEPAVEAVLATTASVNLGPFTAGIERVGLRAVFTFPETGGNLGPANVELDFKPPNGIGLAIDSGVIVGGGYLFFDPKNEQYAGILQLEFGETISLTAIGLLTTRLPDGSPGGFSLLAIIFAEGFSPIPLGFGFTLNGVGGLIGANRTTIVDTMRTGLKNGTMGSILFPSDPIRNAPQIISDLNTVFPAAPERHLFGPMAIIGWGSPTLLTLEIALLLELPEPVRLILLGRLTAMLPSEEEALVRVRMDAIGVVDFGRGEISLDASLYDSRILMFALTGDMAMRVSLGERPNFVLAIGGFNPRFAAPPGLPRLSRLALSLATGDNPRLRLEAYLALTSNTVQFGARLELLATAGPFSLEGLLGFDAMFQFDPFQFIADLVAGVALRYEGRILMAVHLDAALSGPAPWHVRGSASFQILLFKVSVAFDASFGPKPPPAELPKAANVLDMLAEALADPGNWSGELAPNARPLVSLRPAPKGAQTLLVHPLARPTVRQRVAPLGQTIEKFGNRRLEAGPRAYTVAALAEDGRAPLVTSAVGDVFALGQFREMSDDEKLSRPSFERFDSGLCFGEDALVYHHDRATDGTFGYEQRTIDPDAADGAARREEELHLMPAAVFEAVVGLGAAGQAPVRRTGAARYRDTAPMIGSPATR